MKRRMLQFSAERAAFLDKIILACGYPTEKKKMFGHEVHFLNTYMFSGANKKGIFVHVGKETKEAALNSETGAAAFEPMEGMTMKDYLLLEEPVISDPDALKKWLDRSSRYIMGLSPKEKKKKQKAGKKTRKEVT